MYGLLRKLTLLLVLFLFTLSTAHADRLGLLLSEPDGAPADEYAYKMIVPNGTITIANGVATLINAAGTFPALHEITMSATDPIGIQISGETNDYTGATASVGLKLDRDINRGTGNAITNATGWQSYLNQKHTDALLTGDREVYGAISRINNMGAITNATASDYQYWSNGGHFTAKMQDTATFDTDAAGVLELTLSGIYGYAYGDDYTIYDTSA